MRLSDAWRNFAPGTTLRATNIPAILAALVIAAAWLLAEHQNRRIFEQGLRAEVLGHVSLIRAKLEGNVNSNIQLARGLVATLATEPQMDQQRFAALSSALLQKKSHIRNIAAAPGFVVTLMYPQEGNERAVGLDYRENEAQRDAVLRARDTGELILAGPLDLVQGGEALIGRFPVFTPAIDGSERFWGIVSAVIDLDPLYAASGLLDPDLPIEMALAGKDASGTRGERFFGKAHTFADDPVLVDVLLPSGSWQIAATPKGGWPQTPPNSWTLRALILFAGALILIPTLVTGRLIDERQRNIGELKRANALTAARNTELENARAHIEHNALHDSLTLLPNRRYLDEQLADHAEKFADEGERAGLLQIDLDRFKQINDTLGHNAGDAMLIHAAAILKAAADPSDFVARIGGDEFVVVRRWKKDDAAAGSCSLSRLAERIVACMQEPLDYQGHECRVGVSIGIATDMDLLVDPLRLLVNADIALYRAKERGRNRYQFFTEALQAEIVTTKQVADDILAGLEQNQFIAHYQPQFDAATLDVIGVEALARWNHPARGLLAPGAFLKIAEELNVVATIDRMILEQAIVDFHRWEELGVAVPKVSVNVSARRLRDDELIAGLRQMNIRPSAMAFELVESIFLDDNDEILTWNVDHIKELGVDIEIDDFGTGYASIVSLMKLKPQRLKIARELVSPIVHSAGQRQLVGSIVEIGHSLGIKVLAEGVETMEHAHILRGLGCDALQGYAFARPMSSSDIVDFVRSRRWRKAS